MTPQQVAGRLQYLCNKYGDFKVCRSWKDSKGETQWSKHRSVMECWESEAGIAWLGTISHRQILPCEIVIDLDDNPTEKRLNHICDLLDKMNEKYEAYFTGSRGYHIHIYNNEFIQFTKLQREQVRKWFLGMAGGDLMKSYDVMIALENVPHWKTGKTKTLVRKHGIIN